MPDTNMYRQTSNVKRTKFQNLNVFRLVLQLSLHIQLKPGVKPTGDAPITSEWSAVLLPTQVLFILDIWRCIYRVSYNSNMTDNLHMFYNNFCRVLSYVWQPRSNWHICTLRSVFLTIICSNVFLYKFLSLEEPRVLNIQQLNVV